MNAKITFFKDKRIEQENSIKIKEVIKNYLNFIYMDYLQTNMTTENTKEMEELMSMFSGDNQNILDLEKKLKEILSGGNEIVDFDKEDISKKLENILKDINEENEYFMGKKTMPLSENLLSEDLFI